LLKLNGFANKRKAPKSKTLLDYFLIIAGSN